MGSASIGREHTCFSHLIQRKTILLKLEGIDKIGYGLFTPISSHVINPLIKLLLILLQFRVMKTCPMNRESSIILKLPKSMVK